MSKIDSVSGKAWIKAWSIRGFWLPCPGNKNAHRVTRIVSHSTKSNAMTILSSMWIGIGLIFLSSFTWAQAQCTDSDRERHIRRENSDLTHALQECGSKSWGDPKGTEQCLRDKYPDLSPGCAACYGVYTGCVRSNCWASCAFSHGKSCQNCAQQYCRTDLANCTGVHPDELPSRD